MAFDWSVPFAPGLLIAGNDAIAKGITPPDISKLPDQFFAGQDLYRKQQLQSLFADGLPRDASGKVDWAKASEMILQAQGPEGLPGAISASKYGLLSNYYQNAPSGPDANPGVPPAPTPPPPRPQSSVQPDLPPSVNRVGATVTSDKNIGEVTGVDTSAPVEGNAALFGRTPQRTSASFEDRYNSAFPDKTADTTELSAQQAQRPRVYIPGPGPQEATPQSPTGDVGAVPGGATTSGGFSVTEENARRYEKAAADLYGRAEALAGLDPAMGAAARSRADSYSAIAKDIRDKLGKNIELTPDQKAARDAGLSQLEYQRRQEANKLDVKTFQEEQASINNLARNAVTGMQKAALGKQLTQQPNFYSGPWNEYATTYQQFRNLFGNPGAALPNEAFQKVANDMLQESIKSMGQSGVGRVLMSEVAIMQRAIASMGVTDVSNRALLEMNMRTYKKAMEIADLTRNLPPNSQQQEAAIQKYLRAHPMFNEDELRNPVLLGSKEPPPQAARWSPQQLQQWGSQNGLKSGDPFMFNGQLRAIP